MSNADFCQQRKIAQQNNVPQVRFELVSPYNRYTKPQLDMRRKAETLKYSANKSSTQTNNLTKKQSFALLARGSLQKPSMTALSSGSGDCPPDRNILTPSSSSGVPGPVVYLYEDPAVPLYNYSDFNTRTYSDFVASNNAPWQVVTYSDVSLNSKIQGSLFYLIFSNYIDQPIHTFDVTIPIGISISGVRKSGVFPDTIFVSVQYATLAIYYNTEIVTTIRNPNIGNDSGFNIGFDVSNNSPGAISLTQYIGNFGFNEIQLLTSPTYVYSFQASFSMTLTTDSTTTPDVNDLVLAYFGTGGLKIQLVANMSPNKNILSNCNVSVISYTPANEFNLVNTGASIVEHV